MGGLIILLGIALFLIQIGSLWVLFQKADEPGWAAIIPIYNIMLLFRVGGLSAGWVLTLAIPVVNGLVGIWLWLRVAEQFGRGALFGLGLAFLPFIFLPILAFGESVYGAGGMSPSPHKAKV